jgi:hypothetical protein
VSQTRVGPFDRRFFLEPYPDQVRTNLLLIQNAFPFRKHLQAIIHPADLYVGSRCDFRKSPPLTGAYLAGPRGILRKLFTSAPDGK